MIRARKLRASPAIVIACLALFVALGSGSYAAVKLKANAVKTKNIKNAAVTTGKLADAAVTAPKIAGGAVTNDEIHAVVCSPTSGGSFDVAAGEMTIGWVAFR